MLEHVKEYLATKFGRGQNVDVPDEVISSPIFILKKGDLLPENAQMLDMTYVLQQQQGRINKWKNKWEICFLQYGSNMLGLSSSVFGIYMASHYRTLFNIVRGGLATSFLVPTSMSYMMCVALNEWTTKSKILTKTQGECEACMEVKAGLYQAVAGGLFPVFSAYLSSMLVAHKNFTYSLPSAIDFKGNGKLFVKFLPKSNIVAIAFLFQMTVGMAVAKGQLKDFAKLMADMYSEERSELWH